MLHRRFIATAKRGGHITAIHDFTADRTLCRREVLIAGLLLSRRFRRLTSSSCIGVMIPVSIGCAVAQLAVLFSGRIPVMINYSTGAEENARYAQRTCGFKTIITSKALLKRVGCPKVEGMVFLEEIFAAVKPWEKMRAAAIAALPLPLLNLFVNGGSNEDTAVILFTSGSEKEPKAVQLSHKNIEANIKDLSSVFTFTEEDTFVCTLPWFHVYGLTVTMWLPLLAGINMLTLADPLDYARICRICRDHGATLLIGTPTFLQGYLRKSAAGDFQTLRVVIVGADKCPDSLRKSWRETHGITLLEGYGATECSPVISVNTLEYNRPGSVGKPLPGIRVRIEHYETGRECAPDEDGRILVSGDSVMKGYFNNFEQTSLHLRNGWYDTGDMGHLDDDGCLWHVGRLKRFVKIGGEMVSLVKTESELDKITPEEIECCVVEVPDPRKGAKLVAVVTGEIDRKATLKALAKVLPKIAIPKVFLVEEQLPKMGSGKIDFQRISETTKEKLLSED